MSSVARSPRADLVIASRRSDLAMWQARNIESELRARYPALRVSIAGMTTLGDRILDRPLDKIGGKALFVKELEEALTAGSADIAVHSMKDVPMMLPDGFAIAAITAREDPRDAFVANDFRTLAQIPPGGIVGTSSSRRESQIRERFPQLRVEALRGNVPTRLRQLDDGHYAAIILAVAGLKRLALSGRITSILPAEESLPAPGQGALGIECLSERTDILEMLGALNDGTTAACVNAERAMSRALGGNCQLPLAALGEAHEGALRLRGFVATRDGLKIARAEVRGPLSAPEALGHALAARLLELGAAEILASIG